MKAMQAFASLLFAICATANVASLAQTMTSAQAQRSLVGSWLVTVEGDLETRTLIVAEESPIGTGVLLDAKYGMTSQRQGPISAKMVWVADQRQMILVTQAGTNIAAAEQSDGNFNGTFTLKNGNVKQVAIVRISEEKRHQLAEAASMPALQKPAPDVPASCAGFFGGWAGTWSIGNLGAQRLWVLGIRADCTARVSYRVSTSNDAPRSLSTAKIEKGTLSMPCGQSGMCVFELHGDDIWASYTNIAGNINNGVFRKLQ